MVVDALSFLDLTESDRFLIEMMEESEYCAADDMMLRKAPGVDEAGLVI